MAREPATIGEYLAGLPPEQRAALEKLRKTILAVAPGSEECISYRVPTFRHNGRMLVGFGAAAKHCSFFLLSASILKGFEEELDGLDVGKGTIRFQPDKPLPIALVRKLVKARMAENAARGKKRK